MKETAKIREVEKGSLAFKAGLRSGDTLVSINGEKIYDILDYRFMAADEKLTVVFLNTKGEEKIAYISNPCYEDLGIVFEKELIDKTKSCSNKCVFCFIDQLPKGMRESMYFKDDDVRLSFMLGNYVTFTNLKDEDIERLIKRRISPINISVHTTNPSLRCKMLNNKNAGRIYEIMQRLAKNNIEMNCQIVLCPGYNDKEELDRTISDLLALYPHVTSVSVVPVGITKHREGLAKMETFSEESAKETLCQIRTWQEKALLKTRVRFVYPGDEFYIMAKEAFPPEEDYDGYPQIENGVGLITSMNAEVEDALQDVPNNIKKRTVSIITGMASKDFMESIAKRIMEKCKNLSVQVFPIINHFFGETITVSGLLCGCDIIEQLRGKDLGDEALIPITMLRYGTDVLLDDVTVLDLKRELSVPITVTECNGYDLTNKIIGKEWS